MRNLDTVNSGILQSSMAFEVRENIGGKEINISIDIVSSS